MRRLLFPLVLVIALAGGVLASPAASATAAADLLSAVSVTGAPGQRPTIEVSAPVKVKQSTAKVVSTGTGEKLRKGDVVTLDFVFVNGRTGAELDTSYGIGSESITLNRSQTQPVVVDNLVGESVGSRVLIAISPKEGIAEAFASDEVKKNDTLLFVVDIQAAHAVLERAEGEQVEPVDGLPTVKLAKSGKPTITMPETDAPTGLVAQPLVKGSGPEVQAGQTLTVHYTGAIWDSGKVFDSSWKTGTPVPFVIGTGNVIAGWDEGLVGQTVGSQVLLVMPPDKGYGAAGNPGAGIEGTDTLVFVVDILDAV